MLYFLELFDKAKCYFHYFEFIVDNLFLNTYPEISYFVKQGSFSISQYLVMQYT